MRHRMRGRKLGRNSSHRKAMFRNMACSLIRSVRVDENDPNTPKVPGRIVTTVAKAKELRPFVEKLVTMAKKASQHTEKAAQFATSAPRDSAEWKNWRESEQWNGWNQAVAPALAFWRRAFAALRDKDAVDILFNDLAERFTDRPGGYTRVLRLATVRLGDSGQKALIEFVGERDRVKSARKAPAVTDADESPETAAEEIAEEGQEPPEASEPPSDVEDAPEQTEPMSESQQEESDQGSGESESNEEKSD